MENSTEPYMTLKTSGQGIPDNKELSALDIKALKEFYAPPRYSLLRIGLEADWKYNWHRVRFDYLETYKHIISNTQGTH